MVRNWILLCNIFLCGCFPNDEKVREDFIPKDNLISILIELEQKQLLNDSKLDFSNTINSDSVVHAFLQQYGYSYDVYEKTIFFYLDKPKEMIDILQVVKDSLSN